MRGVFLRILTILGVTAYIFLAGNSLHPGFSYVQRWGLDLEGYENPGKKFQESGVPFLTKDYFGYTDPEGESPLVLPLEQGVALGKESFCSYNRPGENMVIRDPAGKFINPLPVFGYPHALGEYFFVLSHDMTGFSVLNGNGELLFKSGFSTLITSIDSGETLIGVGLLNGEVHLFNLQGNNLEVLKPVGSRISAVYGTAVSRSGNLVALTHGIDPQVISFYRSQTGGFKRIKSFTLPEAARSQVVMGFSRDELLLFSETPDGFDLVRTIEPYTRREIPVEGTLVDYHFSNDGKQLFVLTSSGKESLLYFFSPNGTLINREEFKGQGTWLTERDDSIFMGLDNRLTRIDVIGDGL